MIILQLLVNCKFFHIFKMQWAILGNNFFKLFQPNWAKRGTGNLNINFKTQNNF